MRRVAGVGLQVLAEVARDKLNAGTGGERDCPVCGGRIRWRVGQRGRRGVNVRGACETPKCVSFIT